MFGRYKKTESGQILHDTDFYEIVNTYFDKMHTHMHTYDV